MSSNEHIWNFVDDETSEFHGQWINFDITNDANIASIANTNTMGPDDKWFHGRTSETTGEDLGAGDDIANSGLGDDIVMGGAGDDILEDHGGRDELHG